MLDIQRIGKKIHDYRVERGYNQDEISELLYVSRQAVSRWETGLSLPTVDNLVELSKLFKVSVEELLCLDEEAQFCPEDPFKGHDRAFVVKKLCDGTANVNISEIFYLLSPEERMIVLRSFKNRGEEIQRDLWVKLTKSEQNFLTNGVILRKGF